MEADVEDDAGKEDKRKAQRKKRRSRWGPQQDSAATNTPSSAQLPPGILYLYLPL